MILLYSFTGSHVMDQPWDHPKLHGEVMYRAWGSALLREERDVCMRSPAINHRKAVPASGRKTLYRASRRDMPIHAATPISPSGNGWDGMFTPWCGVRACGEDGEQS